MLISAILSRYRLSSSLALILPVLLGACTTLPSATQTPSSAVAQSRAYHPAIELAGRLSVRYEKDGNEESLHGSFIWEQSPDQTIVTLLSPLGQTLARIEITPHAATLMQPGQMPHIAQDVDALTARTLGWPLPVSGLKAWLQGFILDPQGKGLAAVPAESGTLTTPDDWRLRYVSWQQDGEPRPRRINLERHTAQAGEVALRIVVDRWQPR